MWYISKKLITAIYACDSTLLSARIQLIGYCNCDASLQDLACRQRKDFVDAALRFLRHTYGKSYPPIPYSYSAALLLLVCKYHT